MPKPKTPETDSSSNTSDRDGRGRFLAGNSGNGGRKPGARSKLGSAFLEALATDFNEHGVETIARVRAKDPSTYLKIIKDVLPRELVIAALNVSTNIDFESKDDARAFLQAFRCAQEPEAITIEHEEGPLQTPGSRAHDD